MGQDCYDKCDMISFSTKFKTEVATTMYKGIAFFDLDHTLYNEQTKVDPEVANAMKQLRTNNVLPVISTGRNIFEIPETLAQTEIDTVVSANGSYVVFEKQPLYKAVIKPQVVTDLMAFAKSMGESTTVMNHQGAAINFITDTTRDNYHFINSRLPPLDADKFVAENDICMMLLNTAGHDDDYLNKFNDELTFFRNTPFSMDVVIKNGSKRRGIEELISKAGLAGIPTYAFGDGNNDIPMLKYVDHPVAMGNGLDVVKDHAEYVTTANTDHGIVNGLKHYNLI